MLRWRPLLWVLGGGLALLLGVAAAVAWPRVRPSPAPVASPAGGPTLPEENRKHIWDIEHQGLVLKKYGFSALKNALRDADRAALLGLLAADFQGAAQAEPREIIRTDDYLAAQRHEEVVGQPPQPVSREAFVDRLLAYRRRFVSPPGVDLALMTLSPEKADDMAGPWQGEVQLRMWGGVDYRGRPQADVLRAVSLIGTAPGGLAGLPAPPGPGEVVLLLPFHIVAPTEENLSPGGWLRGCVLRQAVVEEASNYLFKDVTTQRGIDPSLFYDNWTRGSKPLQAITGGVFLCDFDRDGCLDMLIVDVNRVVLYKGRPDGTFTDVTAAAGLPRAVQASLVAAFVDLDGDGWEDLILDRKIFRNVSDGHGGRRFDDATLLCNLHIPDLATGITVADYDRDGHLDLYITCAGTMKASSWVDGTGAGPGNQLWRNKGKGFLFENVTEASGTGGGGRSSFSAVWLDADNDGWPDLYAINEFGDGVLLMNQHDGTFREKHLSGGPGDFGSMGVTCGDIDNDGNIDLYVASMYSKAGARIMGNVPEGAFAPELTAQMKRFVTGSQLYLNKGGTRFERKGTDYRVAAVGWAYGAALIDLDNDGWLDLVATCGFISEDHAEPDG